MKRQQVQTSLFVIPTEPERGDGAWRNLLYLLD